MMFRGPEPQAVDPLGQLSTRSLHNSLRRYRRHLSFFLSLLIFPPILIFYLESRTSMSFCLWKIENSPHNALQARGELHFFRSTPLLVLASDGLTSCSRKPDSTERYAPIDFPRWTHYTSSYTGNNTAINSIHG